MSNWFLLGILCFLQVFISFGKDLQSSPGEIQFLCTILPEILKEKCAEYNENKFENKIKIKVHADIEISTTSKSIECEICKRVIQEVLNEIGNDHSRDAIRKALEKVCDNVPPFLKSGCKDFVDKFTDELIDMIIKNLPVNQICQQFGLCSSINIHHSKKIKSIQCMICKRIIEEIFRRIGNKRTEDVIKRGLQSICYIFPSHIRDECRDFMNRFSDEIIKLIMNNAAPELICNILQLCSMDKIQKLNASKSIQCEICKRVIQEVLNEIGNDHSRDVIRQVLENVCDNVPPFLKSGCKDFVDKFTDELIDMIMKNLPVDQICQNFGLCSSINIHHSKKIKSIQCMICKELIEEIFKRIGKKRTADAIRRALQNVCYIFPSNIRKECRNFMNRFSNQIVQLIMNNSAPNLICNILQICSTRKIQMFDDFNSKDSYIFFE